MRRAAAAALLVLLTVACGRTAEAPAPDPVTTVSPASLRAGQPVPPPAGRAVLELTGKVTGNKGRAVLLDLATIGRMGLVRVTVFEPWVKRELSFRGVWLADVLRVAGAPAGAALRIVALDDYVVELPAADVAAGGILLAIADGDGRDIAVADGGPTRIVYTAGTRAGENPDRWIWSLRTIDVR